jgi:hypothetical protein
VAVGCVQSHDLTLLCPVVAFASSSTANHQSSATDKGSVSDNDIHPFSQPVHSGATPPSLLGVIIHQERRNTPWSHTPSLLGVVTLRREGIHCEATHPSLLGVVTLRREGIHCKATHPSLLGLWIKIKRPGPWAGLGYRQILW